MFHIIFIYLRLIFYLEFQYYSFFLYILKETKILKWTKTEQNETHTLWRVLFERGEFYDTFFFIFMEKSYLTIGRNRSYFRNKYFRIIINSTDCIYTFLYMQSLIINNIAFYYQILQTFFL